MGQGVGLARAKGSQDKKRSRELFLALTQHLSCRRKEQASFPALLINSLGSAHFGQVHPKLDGIQVLCQHPAMNLNLHDDSSGVAVPTCLILQGLLHL